VSEYPPIHEDEPNEPILAALHKAIESMGGDDPNFYTGEDWGGGDDLTSEDDIEVGTFQEPRIRRRLAELGGHLGRDEGMESGEDFRAELRDRLTQEGPEPLENRVDLPPNIHELLDEGITDTGMGSGDTIIFAIEGHPDLLARLNPGNPADVRLDAKRATDRLLHFDVEVLPSEVVEHRGEAYVITKRVDGVPLLDVLTGDLSDESVEALEDNWEGLTEALVDARETGRLWPPDAASPEQYMVGTLPGDPVDVIRFIDHPHRALNLDFGDTFESELLRLANGVSDIEARTGRRLARTREAIEWAMQRCRDSQYYGDGLVQATRHVLETGMPLQPHDDDDDDDKIMRLRTR
jgi:hypothetical protein